MNRKERSFTLVELVVVVIIIGVLATIALPSLFKSVEKSRRSEAINFLTKMYRGYKTLIVDEVLSTATGNFINGSNFNPDESDTTPDNPNGRSVMSWKALEFYQNPNTEYNNFYFSYDFLKSGESSEDGQGREGSARPPNSSGMNIGVAWRKTSNHFPWGDLFSVDFDKYIFINMDTGEISKSEHY